MRTSAYIANDCTHHETRDATLSTRIGAVVKRAWLRSVAANRRRATERALASLSDRALHDIGLHRSEIPATAREVAESRYLR